MDKRILFNIALILLAPSCKIKKLLLSKGYDRGMAISPVETKIVFFPVIV